MTTLKGRCSCQTATQKTAIEKRRLTIATVSRATIRTATDTLERRIKKAIGCRATTINSDCQIIERLLLGRVAVAEAFMQINEDENFPDVLSPAMDYFEDTYIERLQRNCRRVPSSSTPVVRI